MARDLIGDGTVAVEESVVESVPTARATIIQGFGDKPLRMRTAKNENPYRMWGRLNERYALSNVTSMVQLQTKRARTMYSNQSMSDYIEGFKEVFNCLEGIDSPIAETFRIAMLLALFGDKNKSLYERAIYCLQSWTNTRSWAIITSKLLQASEERQWASSSSKGLLKETPDGSIALTAASSRKFTQSCKQKTERCRCFSCNTVGHLARNCSSSQTSTCRDSDEKQVSFANHAVMMIAGTFKGNEEDFMIHSGTSDHMVRNAEWLENRNDIEPRPILLGNGRTVLAKESGTLVLNATIRDNEESHVYRLCLEDVLVVPALYTIFYRVLRCVETISKSNLLAKMQCHEGWLPSPARNL